ncbi:MAG: hypothetical protein Q8J78_14150 [Moraxellaceae bacterium]|nr:hypothetical protein [Moraxellaceae bacterium]
MSISLCFVVGDILLRLGMRTEYCRKSVHVLACAVISAFPLFGLGYHDMVGVALLSAATLLLLRRTVLLRSILSVERTSYGEIMMALSVLALALAEVGYQAFLLAYVILGLSDTLASLVGQRYGAEHHVFVGHTKSYVGSAAFLGSCLLICLVSLVILEAVSARAVGLAVLISLGLTAVEAISSEGTDNFLVPVLAALSIDAALLV